jgi:hypothetical protein
MSNATKAEMMFCEVQTMGHASDEFQVYLPLVVLGYPLFRLPVGTQTETCPGH